MVVLVLKHSRHQIFSQLSLILKSILSLYKKFLYRICEIEALIDSQQSSSNVKRADNSLPFDLSLILSSSVDITIYQIARTALNEYMHENFAFSTPVKTFVDRYTKSLDRVWMRNSIVQMESPSSLKWLLELSLCTQEISQTFQM